jgi:hypothetical protein
MLCMGIEPLSQIGGEDAEALEKITGWWAIDDTRFVHQYTGHFAVRIDGLKYFLYKRAGAKSSQPYIYTVIKSKKTGRLYFARGKYQNGRLLGTTSRIVFKGSDRFIVYSEKNPGEIYFQAARIKQEQPDPSTGR